MKKILVLGRVRSGKTCYIQDKIRENTDSSKYLEYVNPKGEVIDYGNYRKLDNPMHYANVEVIETECPFYNLEFDAGYIHFPDAEFWYSMTAIDCFYVTAIGDVRSILKDEVLSERLNLFDEVIDMNKLYEERLKIC